jgi:hypothetical protein
LQLPLLALAVPSGQVRGVEALAAQQRTDVSGLGAGIGLFEDAQFVLCREALALGAGSHLGWW